VAGGTCRLQRRAQDAVQQASGPEVGCFLPYHANVTSGYVRGANDTVVFASLYVDRARASLASPRFDYFPYAMALRLVAGEPLDLRVFADKVSATTRTEHSETLGKVRVLALTGGVRDKSIVEAFAQGGRASHRP
jgi:hypothetical protein